MSRIGRNLQKGPPLPLFVEAPPTSQTAQRAPLMPSPSRRASSSVTTRVSSTSSAVSGVAPPPAPSARELSILTGALRNAPATDSAEAKDMIDALRLLLSLAVEVESKRGGGLA